MVVACMCRELWQRGKALFLFRIAWLAFRPLHSGSVVVA